MTIPDLMLTPRFTKCKGTTRRIFLTEQAADLDRLRSTALIFASSRSDLSRYEFA